MSLSAATVLARLAGYGCFSDRQPAVIPTYVLLGPSSATQLVTTEPAAIQLLL